MKKPNILIIFADQMRADGMACAGNPVIKTPNLDRLAGEGLRFENCYSPDPVCVPARASLTTGNYPHKCTGHKSNSGAIKNNQVTIANYFKEHGYATMASGKLHYLPYAKPHEKRTLYGFELAQLAESGRIVMREDPQNKLTGIEDYHDYLKSVGWGGFSRAHGIGNNDIHPSVSAVPGEHCVDAWVASTAIDMLTQHRTSQDERPFFMFMSFPKPHAPYDPPPEFAVMYDPRTIPAPLEDASEMQRTPHKYVERITHGWNLFSPEMYRLTKAYYYGLISFQDFQIGRMLNYLESTGELDNTIIVYSADHGDMMGDFGFFAKSCFYNGSVKVPLIIRYPKAIPRNQVSHALVGLQDIFPSVSSLAGIKLAHQVDGIDFLDCTQSRDFIISYYLDDPEQIYMIANEKYKYIYSQLNKVEEFFDLVEDPNELVNQVRQDKYHNIIEDLKQKMIQWAKDNQDQAILDQDGRLVVNICPDVIINTLFDPNCMGWRWY